MDGGGHGGGHGGHGGGHFGGHSGGPDGGMGGPASEQPAGVRLTQCDDRAIVAVRGWGASRLVGLPFLAFGLYFAATGLLSVAQPEYTAGSLFLIAIGLLVATPGYLMLQPWKLEMDVAARTYEVRCGWGPLGRVRRGGPEDFGRLITRKYRDGAGGTDLLLYWKDATRPPAALFTGTEEEAARLGREVAGRLGLPFEGSKAERASTA